MNFVLKYAWTVWIGAALGFLYNSALSDWRWSIFVIVTVILVGLHDKAIGKQYEKQVLEWVDRMEQEGKIK